MVKFIIPLILMAIVFYFKSPTHKEKGLEEQVRNQFKTLSSVQALQGLPEEIKQNEREKVDNQYPIINIEHTLLTVNKSNLDVADVEKIRRRALTACGAYFSAPSMMADEGKLLAAHAKVAQKDGIIFKYTFKDKMGKIITTEEQKITYCPDFQDAISLASK